MKRSSSCWEYCQMSFASRRSRGPPIATAITGSRRVIGKISRATRAGMSRVSGGRAVIDPIIYHAEIAQARQWPEARRWPWRGGRWGMGSAFARR